MTTIEKIKALLDQHNEATTHAFIEYLCVHTKCKPHELRHHWTSFKKNSSPTALVPHDEKTNTVFATCTHVFTRGSNAGSTCTTKVKDGSKFCTKHNKSKKIAITEKVLEKDIQELVSEDESVNTAVEEDDDEEEVVDESEGDDDF